jgi:hypothetical protein
LKFGRGLGLALPSSHIGAPPITTANGSSFQKPCFTMGFLTGHELTWMPEALRILRDELPNIDVMISSLLFFERNERCQTWRSVFS